MIQIAHGVPAFAGTSGRLRPANLFGATLRNALPVAVGAPKGQRIHVTGLNNLKPNPR